MTNEAGSHQKKEKNRKKKHKKKNKTKRNKYFAPGIGNNGQEIETEA